MAHNHDHAPVLDAALRQYQGLFESSTQAMYLYVDDANKACNARFADLLGYPSPAAWAAVKQSFPAAFVAPESQDDLVDAFQGAMQDGSAAVFPVVWKRKDGKTAEADVVLVPVEVAGHRIAVHYVEPAEPDDGDEE
jgi:PAS domain-containing protein